MRGAATAGSWNLPLDGVTADKARLRSGGGASFLLLASVMSPRRHRGTEKAISLLISVPLCLCGGLLLAWIPELLQFGHRHFQLILMF
jgi:hypothetical protein